MILDVEDPTGNCAQATADTEAMPPDRVSRVSAGNKDRTAGLHRDRDDDDDAAAVAAARALL